MTSKKQPNLLRFAFICGITPLLFGSCVYGLWRLTDRPELMLVGILTIFLGTILVIGGLGCLVPYVVGRGPNRLNGLAKRFGFALLVATLLLSNFPAAKYYMDRGARLTTNYGVTVINESGQAIDQLRITYGGKTMVLQPMPEGTDEHFSFLAPHNGRVELSAQYGTHNITVVVDTHVRPLVESRLIFIKPEGEIQVLRRENGYHR